jgi:hypothetical protein
MWRASHRAHERKERGYFTVLHGFPAPSTWKSTSDSIVGIDAIFVEGVRIGMMKLAKVED